MATKDDKPATHESTAPLPLATAPPAAKDVARELAKAAEMIAKLRQERDDAVAASTKLGAQMNGILKASAALTDENAKLKRQCEQLNNELAQALATAFKMPFIAASTKLGAEMNGILKASAALTDENAKLKRQCEQLNNELAQALATAPSRPPPGSSGGTWRDYKPWKR